MAKKKEIIEEVVSHETIIEDEIENVLSNGFGRYSKYVLQDRAVPDVRDGLKPVQRRIIYTMYLEGNFSSRPTRKCARTVGAVIGRFHPHGDTSVYEAMVRLSQDWKMRIPLIDFQGNNGSIDGDGPAAYRYTEARLAEVADLMVQDLNKNTCDMELNFDDQELEPTVLPCRFPNILVNGSQGIGIGSSTDIPPHNLGEVIDATIYRINHKRATIDDLLTFIKGPDFPTGGIITNPKDLKNIYETGNGTIRLMCKTHIEEDRNCNQIIIDEIPFGVDKSQLVQKIAKFKMDNNVDTILDVRDETDKDGIRICIDTKKETDVDTVYKYILSKGVLTSTVKFNMLVIDHYRPCTLSLMRTLDCYIEHQKDVIIRRSKFDLEKYEARLHIVDGLVKAFPIIHEIIDLIEKATDKNDARTLLMSRYNFSEKQAESIVTMQLYRLSHSDINALREEQADLNAKIKDLNELLASEDKLNRLITNDLKEVKEKYNTERKTQFLDAEIDLTINPKDLVTKEEVMVVFTRDGYLKRSSLKSYNSSLSELPGLKDGDVTRGITKCLTTDLLYLFTSQGGYLSIPVYKIFDTKWKEEGKHINEIGALSNSEKIVSGVVVHEPKEGVNIVLCSRLGQIKRCALEDFETSRIARSSKCFNLNQDDEVIAATISKGNSNVLVANSLGQASLFSEEDFAKVGLKSGGVKAMSKIDKNTYIADMLVFDNKEVSRLAFLTQEHGERVVDYNKIKLDERLSSKVSLYKSFKVSPQHLLAMFKVSKKAESFETSVLLSNRVRATCKYDVTKPTLLESYLKENCDYGSDELVKDVSKTAVAVVDSSIETYIPPVIEEQKTNEVEYEQLSLFDIIDDED